MSDIFISYKREEQHKARRLATALEKQGWSVWWDPKLRAGEYFDEVIEKALDEARCVIVLWSKKSVKSRYVKDEATYALDHGKLAPVAIEAVDLPLRFRGIQTPQLIDWEGDEEAIAYHNLLEDISAILGASPNRDQVVPLERADKVHDDDKGMPGKRAPVPERQQRQVEPDMPDLSQPTGRKRANKTARIFPWLGLAGAVLVGVIIWQQIPPQEVEVHETAEQRRQAKIEALITEAEQVISEGKTEKARLLLEQLAQLAPGNPHLVELERGLNHKGQEAREKAQAQVEAKSREEAIANLLDRARAAEAALHLTTPASDNAVDHYRGVLELDPDNAAAKAGLQRVVERYLDWAEKALTARRLGDVEKHLEKAARVDPDHPGIRRLLEEKAQWEKQRENTQTLDLGEMVRIEAGCFQMGSPDTEKDRNDDERQHRVCIEKPFRLAKTEVTVAQFSRFVEATGYRTDAERNQGGEEGCHAYDGDDAEDKWAYRAWASWRKPNKYQANSDDHPVACVSWNDAMAFIAWLNEQSGEKGYRLPTEAEWEYAARAGSQGAYFWADKVDDQACLYANVADKGNNWGEPNFPCDDRHEWASPVGNYRPNDWGLNDMLGNLWEWTCSAYEKDYKGAEKVCAAEGSAARRVIRGGGGGDEPWYLRSAFRFRDYPDGRFNYLGFRLARDL